MTAPDLSLRPALIPKTSAVRAARRFSETTPDHRRTLDRVLLFGEPAQPLHVAGAG
jgi:hypothetical protein